MTRLRVGIFTDNDFEKVNGVSTTLRAVLAHTPDDLKLRIYTCDSTGAEHDDYMAFKSLGVGIPLYREMRVYLPPLGRLLRQVRQDRIDLLHLTTPGPLGLAALYVARRCGLPMVGSFHTHLAEYARLLSGSEWLGAATREFMRWPYGRCAQILVPSEATRRVLQDARIAREKIAIWRRGVSTSLFDPAKRSEALRESWGVSPTRPAILYVGRLSREKGLAIMPGLQHALRRAGVAHRMILVGDGPMRAELERSCPNAVFTGTLPPDAVAVAMASSDLFVFPSRTDTAGNVVLEAQASGLPVLVSDEGGPRENMHPGQTGEVCTQTAEFCTRLVDLLTDPRRRAKYARAARAYAVRRSWDSALEPLFGAYRRVAAAHREAARYPALAAARHHALD